MRNSTEAENLAARAGTLACSICGTANAPGADFCRCCGVSITHRSAFGPLADSAGFCTQCQCAHALPACFCDQCGSKLPGYVRSRVSNQTGSNETGNVLPKDTPREPASPVARAGNKTVASAPVSSAPSLATSKAPVRKSPVRYLVPAALAAGACGALLFSVYQPSHTGIQHEVHIARRVSPAPPTAAPAPPDAVAPSAPVLPGRSSASPETLPEPRPVAMLPSAPAALAKLDMAFAEPAVEAVRPSPPPTQIPTREPVAVSEATHNAIDSGEITLTPVSRVRERPPLPLLEFTSFVQIAPSGD
jgi:hypothetical protein